MEAAQDPREDDARDPAAVKEGVADTWDQAVSRSTKRRKRKRGGEENGPSSAQKAQEEEKPMKTFGPTTRVFLLHGTDTRVPPVGETRRLTSGPQRPLTVDRVSVDLVNDDVSMGHADVSTAGPPDDVMLTSACHVACPAVLGTCQCHCQVVSGLE